MYCIQQPPSTVTKKLLCSSHCYHLSPSSSSSISLSTKCSYLFLLSLFSSHFLMNFSLLLPPIVLSVSFAPSLNHSFMYGLDSFFRTLLFMHDVDSRFNQVWRWWLLLCVYVLSDYNFEIQRCFYRFTQLLGFMKRNMGLEYFFCLLLWLICIIWQFWLYYYKQSKVKVKETSIRISLKWPRWLTQRWLMNLWIGLTSKQT